MIDLKLFWGFASGLTNEQTDICDCRFTFATEKLSPIIMNSRLRLLLIYKMAAAIVK